VKSKFIKKKTFLNVGSRKRDICIILRKYMQNNSLLHTSNTWSGLSSEMIMFYSS